LLIGRKKEEVMKPSPNCCFVKLKRFQHFELASNYKRMNVTQTYWDALRSNLNSQHLPSRSGLHSVVKNLVCAVGLIFASCKPTSN